jgi:hypothetical protein
MGNMERWGEAEIRDKEIGHARERETLVPDGS